MAIDSRGSGFYAPLRRVRSVPAVQIEAEILIVKIHS